MSETGREYRKAINFDLSQEKIKEHYPGKRTKAYSDIKKFFEKENFKWRQGSGYISDEPLPELEIAYLVNRLHTEMPWFKDCVKEIDVTNIIGDTHSLKPLFEFAAEEQAANVAEVKPQREEKKVSIEKRLDTAKGKAEKKNEKTKKANHKNVDLSR